MNKVIFNILFFSSLFLAFGCDRDPQDLEGDEMARLNAWIQVHGLESYKTPSGMYLIVEKEGTGVTPVDSNYLLYNFVIRNLDGFVYQTTYKDTAILYDYFGVYKKRTHYTPAYKMYFKDEFINQGVSEAFAQMKKGSKVRLIIPSKLYNYISYGQESYTSLIFDYELKEIVEDPVAYEQSLINQYLSDNPGFTSIASDSIYYRKKSGGISEAIKNKDTVWVKYTGRYLNDADFVFDSNVDSVTRANGFYSAEKIKPYKIIVGEKSDVTVTKKGVTTVYKVPIPGFTIALRQMKEGEKATIVIPSKSAYGVTGNDNIPHYSTLIFDIEVTDVNP